MMPEIAMEKGWAVDFSSLTIVPATRIGEYWYIRYADGRLGVTPIDPKLAFTSKRQARYAFIKAIQANIRTELEAIRRINLDLEGYEN